MLRGHRETVANVIVAIDGIPAAGEPACHGVVAVNVLRHSVDKLDDTWASRKWRECGSPGPWTGNRTPF